MNNTKSIKVQKIISRMLFLIAFAMIATMLFLFFESQTVYKDYNVELTPGQSFVVGDSVQYIASGIKYKDLIGTVNRYLDCWPGANISGNHLTILIETTATNSTTGPYRLFNHTITSRVADEPRLTYPATCRLRNTVTFKPNIFHPDVSYTAISEYQGKPTYFTLNQKAK